MAKLTPKDKTGMPATLTSVAEMLKNPQRDMKPVHGEVINEKPEHQIVSDKQKSEEAVLNRKNDTIKNTKFKEILEELETKNYACTEVIYIDAEMKEVLSLLKSKGKIKTSSLVSYILEQFLEENKEDINAIIKSSNRFL